MGGLSGKIGGQGKAALLQGSVGKRERQCGGRGRGNDPGLEVVGA